MTKIMRLVNSDCDSAYIVKDGVHRGLEWMDELEVIDMLASTGMKAETSNVVRDDLGDFEKVCFDTLWNDTGTTVDIFNAFCELFQRQSLRLI